MRLRKADETWVATVSCAGHPQPLLCRDGARPTPIGAAGSLLGVFEPTLLDSRTVLRSGDTVLLYTDGVTEAREGDKFFGENRLHETISRLSAKPNELADGVLDEVLRFQGGYPRDDIAIVTVSVP
jgi:serine phosphatase RsbU (regulator of sigma subunit)